MSDKPEYMTRKGKEDLEQKLHLLITDERKKVADRIAAAKELGDISESGEYEDAKKSQSLLEGEIRAIKSTLSRAQIIDEDQNGVREVRIGSTVTVRIDGDDETETWKIVGSTEASPRNGKISNESPIGSQLLGKKEQSEVEVQTPSGPMRVTIVKIN
jgi:transcription elongation factor GreA